jgi:hypothetical protein
MPTLLGVLETALCVEEFERTCNHCRQREAILSLVQWG